MLLPRPYPDELIGSALARGCRQYGLSAKLLLRELVGPGRTTFSFVMASELDILAANMGMDARALLLGHTVFPYATAFMPNAMRRQLFEKTMRSSSDESIGPISKVVTHGVPNRRLCTECVAFDLGNVGEAYWHRAHNLPGVLICSTHNRLLMSAGIPLRGRGQSSSTSLPDLVVAESAAPLDNWSAMHTVMRLSTLALTRKPSSPVALASAYRQAALDCGYALSSKNIAALAFTEALSKYFDEQYLREAGCELKGKSSNYWPALMLRPGIDVQFAAPKHILMQAFLDARIACPSDAKGSYMLPGPRLPDFAMLDRTLVARLCELVIDAQIEDRRMTVTELLFRSGFREKFRHHRDAYPLTEQFLSEFKRSESSARQVGGRPFWRLRHPSRYGFSR